MSPTIKQIEANVGNITIGTNGYTAVTSFLPSTPTGYTLLDVKIKYWTGSVSTKDAFTVMWNGASAYVLGTAGATINGLKLNCIYILSDDLSES